MPEENRDQWEVVLEDLVGELDLSDLDVDLVAVLDEVISAAQSVAKGLSGDARLIAIGVILLLSILRPIVESVRQNQGE